MLNAIQAKRLAAFVRQLTLGLMILLTAVRCAPTDEEAGSEALASRADAVCLQVRLSSSESLAVTTSTELTAHSATCANGETPEYLFRYRKLDDTPWTTIRDWSASPTVTWDVDGVPAGQYYVQVITRAAGVTVNESSRKLLLFVGPACPIAGLVTEQPSPQEAGTLVGLRANATCIDATPEFLFELESPSGSVTVLQEYGSSASAAWDTSNLEVGTYALRVSARAQGHTRDEGRARKAFTIGAGCARPRVTTSTLEGVPGEVVGVDAESSCDDGAVPEYRFSYRREDTKPFVVFQEWSFATHADWSLAELPAGEYRLRVEVRPSGGAPEPIARRDVIFPVQTCALTDFYYQRSSMPGYYELRADGRCGAGAPPEYRFFYRVPGSEEQVLIRSFGESTTLWDTRYLQAGEYELVAQLREAGSGGEPADEASFDFTLVTYCNGVFVLVADVEPPRLNTQRITFQVYQHEPMACSPGPPEYRFLYRARDGGGETLLRDWGSDRGEANIPVPPGGYYDIVVQARAQGSNDGVRGEATRTFVLGYLCSVGIRSVSGPEPGKTLVQIALSGGCPVGQAQYSSFYRRVGEAEWHALPAASWVIDWDTTGLAPGEYEFRADVRAAGHEVTGSTTTRILLCAPGYTRADAGCVDINECAPGFEALGCDPLTTCTNTVGSRKCGPCPQGYRGDGNSGCVQADGHYVSVATSGVSDTVGDTPPEGHTCAVTTDGELQCWGRNDQHQSDVPAGTYTKVAVGPAHTCALRADDGVVACWGANDAGQATPPPNVAFSALSAGARHTCGIRTDGTVQCWGANEFGQATAPSVPFQLIATGSAYTCGLRPNGELLCWGESFRRLTLIWGSFRYVAAAGTSRPCPIRADGTAPCSGLPHDVRFKQVAISDSFVCGVVETGAARCWNERGPDANSPQGNNFESITAGGSQACALDAEGGLRCWRKSP